MMPYPHHTFISYDERDSNAYAGSNAHKKNEGQGDIGDWCDVQFHPVHLMLNVRFPEGCVCTPARQHTRRGMD